MLKGRKQWKTLKRRRVFKSGYALLEEDLVLTPRGKKIKYLCVGRNTNSVTVVPVLNGNKIPLIYQFRYPHQSYFWELPGGRVDRGEKPIKAARRELKEEMGIRAKKFISLGSFKTAPGIDGHTKYFFLAKGAEFIPDFDKSKFDDSEFIQKIKLFSPQKIKQMIKTGKINVSSTTLLLLLYFNYFKSK